MTEILDGKKVAAVVREEIATEVAGMVDRGLRRPGLAVVLAGDDPASQVYVGSKERSAEEAGFAAATHRLPGDVTREELERLVDELNDDPSVDGILVQMPLPEPLPERDIIMRIDPDKDVDGLHPLNAGRLWSDEDGFVPCTPRGILELLRRTDVELAGKHAVIVGRSRLVGKPIAGLLLAENCTVTMCHSRTRDLPAVCREADLLIAAIGRPAFFGPEHVREGAIVVDVGINRVDDADVVQRLFADNPRKLKAYAKRGSVLVGDVDFGRVAERTAAITPVPGGVGPLTVAMLLANTLQSSKWRQAVETE